MLVIDGFSKDRRLFLYSTKSYAFHVPSHEYLLLKVPVYFV